MKKLILVITAVASLGSTASADAYSALFNDYKWTPRTNPNNHPEISIQDHVYTNTCSATTYAFDWGQLNPCWNTWMVVTRQVAENWGSGKWFALIATTEIPAHVTLQDGFYDDPYNIPGE